jgi:hypothetical protein
MLDKIESRLASPGYGFTDYGLRYIRPPIGAVTCNQLAPFFDGGIIVPLHHMSGVFDFRARGRSARSAAFPCLATLFRRRRNTAD